VATGSENEAQQKEQEDTHDPETCWLATGHALVTTSWIRNIRGNLGWNPDVPDRTLERAHATAEYIRAQEGPDAPWPDPYVLALTVVSITLTDELPPPPFFR
jgi:hypothetical protein